MTRRLSVHYMKLRPSPSSPLGNRFQLAFNCNGHPSRNLPCSECICSFAPSPLPLSLSPSLYSVSSGVCQYFAYFIVAVSVTTARFVIVVVVVRDLCGQHFNCLCLLPQPPRTRSLLLSPMPGKPPQHVAGCALNTQMKPNERNGHTHVGGG